MTAEGVSVHVCVFAFDLLYLNGASCVKKPLRCVCVGGCICIGFLLYCMWAVIMKKDRLFT